MISVGDVLRHKGKQVWSVTPESTVLEALRLMADKGIGALLVIEGGRPVGVFSERDYARKVVLQGRRSPETKVADVMATPVFAVDPRHSLETCMALMTERRLRHLPVLDEGELVGIISIGDVVKELISEKDSVISQLESYIVSGR